MSIKIIKENYVTVDSIYEIFESAFMKAVKPDGDSLGVDFGTHRVLIQVEKESKLLIFTTMIECEDDISLDKSLLWVNDLNRVQMTVKFYVASGAEDKIYWVADCSMSYEMGIIPFQVINMARQFHKISSKSISDFIEKNKG